MKKSGRLWLAALPLMFWVTPGEAQISRMWSVCGGNIFNTCASVEIIIVGTTVTVRALNLSGLSGTYAGTVFTGIGFDNLNLTATSAGSSVTMSGPSIAASPPSPSAWVIQNNTQIGGGLNLNLVGTTPNGVKNGIASNCASAGQLPGGNNRFWASVTGGCTGGYAITNPTTNGGWVQFSFQVLPNTVTQAQLNAATLLVKGQNGPNGQSTELICGPGQCGPPHVVPEPMTIALVGTGLLGLGAARRRRKQKDEAETAN